MPVIYNPYKENQPLRNSIRGKILFIMEHVYGEKSPECKNMVRILSIYNYNTAELLLFLRNAETEFKKTVPYADFDGYDKHYERIIRKYNRISRFLDFNKADDWKRAGEGK